ncbi:hypothetical protein NA57DRAFT_72377 [Rhizodiscina lignyota]|uniref:Carbohydrate esterase family 16 protein n=1 Tax=Rhizodiscina lignyota TaxID=1504668 RepID=A0A9P4IP34_9PEZI|nr:hypothetical protein NA57DRAFT_72377 [Rhizodiscina lignyota]
MSYIMYSLLILQATLATAFPFNIFGHERTEAFTPQKRATTNKYMFVFGDSYSYTGFSWSKTLPSASNPIGNPSFPSTSNTVGGKNLNYVEHLTATYNKSLLLTYNMAAEGADVNKTLINPVVSTTDFNQQTSLWNSNAENHQKVTGWTAANSVYLMWFGINDVYRGYNTTLGLSDPDTLYQTDMNDLFQLAIHMYQKGAKNFVFLTVPPIYRTPLVMSLQNSTKATEDIWNAKLQDFVYRFTISHNVVTSLINTTDVFNEVLDNPTQYGAPNNTCFNSDGVSCLWWDHFHPGKVIHQKIADKIAGAANLTTWFSA